MAAPNIVNVATITGKTYGAALDTTVTTSLVSNSASSGKVFKINTILVSNDGTSDATVTVDHYNGTTGYKIASTINVPADSTLVLLDKNSSLYLEEGCSVRGGASTASDLEILISYEEIS